MLAKMRIRGVDISYYDSGSAGPALVFQHGLTGDHQQILSSFKHQGCRLITMECRGHGQSEMGPEQDLGIETFVDDLYELLNRLSIGRAVFAGISMGAATVARFAAKYPGTASGVVLIRPSWFDRICPENMMIFSLAADFHDLYGPQAGRERMMRSDCWQALQMRSPDNANSLLNIFNLGPECIPLLRRVVLCDPGFDAIALGNLSIPVLVLGTNHDAVHPISLARRIADAIPGSRFIEIHPKSLDKDKHVGELTEAIVKLLPEA